MSAAPKIQGWCPGALRPMRSGDGLLLRAKTIGPTLTAEHALEIVAISESCGNGLIDLSQRAQLQLRGLREATLREAHERLHGLGMLARDAATESVLNFIVSPLAGLGAGDAIDARDILDSLARDLADGRDLHALPGKFGFLIDDGGALGLADVSTDIRLEAHVADDEPRVAVIADGARDRAVLVRPTEAPATALRLARAFLALRKGREFELRRMRSAIAAFGVDALAREARLASIPYRSACRGAHASEFLGVRPLPGPPSPAAGEKGALSMQGAPCSLSRERSEREREGACYAGVGAPFGRLRASDLALLATLARSHGAGELRLTPWRAILLPCASESAAREIVDSAARRGLIVDACDPRLAVVACPGAPECPQAQGATRNEIDRLAPLARRLASEGAALHISGCAKGCAMPRAAKITLVARERGFDLIEDGRAGDPATLSGLAARDLEEALEARLASAEATEKERQPPCPAQ
jgi:precorrin-3B synthase